MKIYLNDYFSVTMLEPMKHHSIHINPMDVAQAAAWLDGKEDVCIRIDDRAIMRAINHSLGMNFEASQEVSITLEPDDQMIVASYSGPLPMMYQKHPIPDGGRIDYWLVDVIH